MSSETELLQLLFDSEPVMDALGFPVSAEAFVAAVKAIRDATEPEQVTDAWNALAGSLGPKLTASLLSGEEWRWIGRPDRFLDDYDSDDHSQAVWVDDEVMVVGRAHFDGSHLQGVRFSVERR
jgi:hypothetical protein